jgi:hypothetical protein
MKYFGDPKPSDPKPSKAMKEYFAYEICGHGRVWDQMSGLEEFCILPVGHSGDHDYRVDTGPWDKYHVT